MYDTKYANEIAVCKNSRQYKKVDFSNYVGSLSIDGQTTARGKLSKVSKVYFQCIGYYSHASRNWRHGRGNRCL